MDFLDKAEKSFYYQKSKCSFIREGDHSTKFFHSMCKRNAKTNHVASIQRSDGTCTVSSTEVLDEFVRFYHDLLGTRTECSPIDETVLEYGPCIDE